MRAKSRARRRPLTDEERAEKRAAERHKMQEAIEALRGSEGWARWLRVRRHFRSYSFANQILIALQKPEATRVAGFRAWLGLGYCMRKGERSIRIWAPGAPSKMAMKTWRDEGANRDNQPRTYFRFVAVFDRSQVEPMLEFPGGPVELELPHQPIEGDGLAHLMAPLTEFAKSIGSEVCFEPVSGSAAGFYEPKTARIVIDVGEEHSPNAQVKTLIHEFAHALVRQDRREDDPKLSYAEEEVVAESVAYTVCSSVGFDTAAYSIPCMAGWATDTDSEPIERYGQLIDRLARSLEEVAIESGPQNTSPPEAAAEQLEAQGPLAAAT